MTDSIIHFLTAYGYVGIFALMMAENVFPPIPSEVVLPFIGHLVATGELNFILALSAASLGALAGTTFWFLVGWFIVVEKLERFFYRYGAYFAITVSDFKKASSFFERYKVPAVLFGRVIPTVRSIISVPAGSVRMDLSAFLFYSAIGTLVWNLALIMVGYVALNDASLAERYIGPIGNAVILIFIILYLTQIIRFLIQKRTRANSA